MKLQLKAGTTSQIVQIFIQDSSKTDGSGLTGLTSGSSGLVCYRARTDDGNAAGTQLSLSGGTRGTWSSGGFVEKDSTNMPGVYELGLDNNGLATGAKSVVYMLKGATNMAPCLLEIELVSYDPFTATNLGLSAIPTANPAASGGMLTVGTGSGQISPSSGKVTTTYTIVKNTAFTAFCLQMVLASDHVSPATGKSVTLQRSIDGGAYADCTNTPMTEISNGTYKINLSAADLNGNFITLKASASGCDTTYIGIVTQS